MKSKSFTTVAVAFGLSTTALVHAQTRPDTCATGAATEQVVSQNNVWCGEMGQVTASGSMETCCPDHNSGRRLLQDIISGEQCRSIETDKAYCDETVSPGCSTFLSEFDVITIDLAIENQGSTGSCCDVCKCFGDPSCISFDGVHDEWVVCDGRRYDCRQRQRTCEDDIDHAGNKCRWLKGTPEWQGWDVSGSPCQADWQKSGHPTMVMYDTGSFKLSLTLGERGVIMSATVETTSGTFVLEADQCFENDPRTSSHPELAWTSDTGASIPSNWLYTTPNDIEIWWQAVDETSGVVAEIACTRALERNRLDVQGLYETNANRPAAATGFCVSGNIEQKSGSTQMTSEIYTKCLEENAPQLLVMCKFLVNPSCSDGSLDDEIEYWCENADVTRTSAQDVEGCKSMLLQGTEAERKSAWTTLVCEANQLDVTQCKTDISQFGLAAFLETHSDGLISQGNPTYTCAENFTVYNTFGESCEKGLQLQYWDSTSGWIDALFVPYLMPPCGNQMKINAAQMPELFTNKIRFQQCGLSAQCIVQNACAAASGFETSFSYETSSCPTPMPTEVPTRSPTDTPTRSPTRSPTEVPTNAPTNSPTNSPTESPTDSPTATPTVSPSNAPTRSPTDMPTESPTDTPTFAPTQSPHAFCTDIMTPGTLVQTLAEFSEKFEVFTDVYFNAPTCGQGDITLMQIGCSGASFFSIRVKDCTTELYVTLASTQTLENTCAPQQALPLEENTVVHVVGAAGGVVIVYYDNEIVCEMKVSGTVLQGANVCVYEGRNSATAPAADACVQVGSVSSSGAEEGRCTQVVSEQPFCGTSTDMNELGTCIGQCPAPTDLVAGPAFSDSCRELVIPAPYCDLTDSSQASLCSKLKTMSGVLDLEFTVDETSTPQSCCQSCSCFGDPECIAFDGSQDNWILCDARNTDCSVKEDICTSELDHAGNKCKWDATRAAALKNQADIGAIGSPCQADWAASGAASMVMFSMEGYTVSITSGERGVIETLVLTLIGGSYTLVADKCFSGSWEDAWEVSPGAPPIDTVLSVSYSEGPASNQRTFEIVEPGSSVYIRAVCLQFTSGNKQYKNARLDVPNLVQPMGDVLNPTSTGGFCSEENAVIDKGQSSNVSRSNEIHDMCQQSMQSSFLLCRALYSPTCTLFNVEEGVHEWCNTANLFPNDPNRIQKCINYIKPTDSNANRVTQRWSEMYCQAVEYHRPQGVSLSVWVKQCVARLQTDGYEEVVAELGKGTFSASIASGSCGSSESSYSKRTEADSCVPGISVEYMKSNGDWVEEMFIPFAFQPCEGKLQVTAKNHYNLFINPIRFRQCSLSLLDCSADVACSPDYGYSVNFEFSQNPKLCPNGQGQSLRA